MVWAKTNVSDVFAFLFVIETQRISSSLGRIGIEPNAREPPQRLAQLHEPGRTTTLVPESPRPGIQPIGRHSQRNIHYPVGCAAIMGQVNHSLAPTSITQPLDMRRQRFNSLIIIENAY
jgi:hypothetical protein